jgi:nucleosome binding factor SPN SPT16 subunit
VAAAIIDQEKEVKHMRFSEKIENALQDPNACQVRLKAENLDSAYPPIVQSGGAYDLRLNAQSDTRNIHFDVVSCQSTHRDCCLQLCIVEGSYQQLTVLSDLQIRRGLC